VEAQASIAFAGTPQFAVPALERLIASGHEPSLVLTQPDRPSGRGRRPAASPVKQVAAARRLRVRQPASLAGAAAQAADWGPRPDLLIVVAYGLLLPQWLLDWPRVAAVNLHASLLPRWRGAAPIQHALLAGDPETGISVMKMELGLDSGPVYLRRSLRIGPGETAAELHERLAELAAEALLEILPMLSTGEAVAEPQDHVQASYAPKILKSHAAIDWHETAAVLERKVRAFNPWPVVQAKLSDGRVMRIWEAEAIDAASAAPAGTIAAAAPAGIDVATGSGLLRIKRLQFAAAKTLTSAAYLNAHSLEGVCFVG
jgi:methionyl-tRNA formyltransferase